MTYMQEAEANPQTTPFQPIEQIMETPGKHGMAYLARMAWGWAGAWHTSRGWYGLSWITLREFGTVTGEPR